MNHSLREEMEKTSSHLLSKIANCTANQDDIARYGGYQASLISESHFTRDMAAEAIERRRERTLQSVLAFVR